MIVAMQGAAIKRFHASSAGNLFADSTVTMSQKVSQCQVAGDDHQKTQ
jgi:hypothetical protein